MVAEHWILVRETDVGYSQVPVGVRARFGESVTVGREGELPLGVEVFDSGVSRNAVTVTPTGEGWRITVGNRNGAVIHPWGLAPHRSRPAQLVHWPLVGIRVAGAEPRHQHWLLLESDAFLDGADGTASQTRLALTRRGAPPPPLAPAELSALERLFEDYLAWPPPTTPPVPRQLKQVANRLGKSLSGVQDRLRSAQDKALRLGLASPVTLTHPDYFHVLVAAGYLMPAPGRPFRHERTTPPIRP
jgi:hypothetical protein